MWAEFFIAVTWGAMFLFVPGYLLLRVLKLPRLLAIGAASMVSTAGYQIVSIALSYAGIVATWLTVFVPVLTLGAICYAAVLILASKGADTTDSPDGFETLLPKRKHQIMALVCYCICGFLVTSFVFVGGLDSPSSYVQMFDNLSHMVRIKNSVETGWFAPAGLDFYPNADGALPYANQYSGFYPSAWHCIAQLVMSKTGCSVAASENVVNFLFIALVYPLGAGVFASLLLKERPLALFVSALIPLSLAAFPWALLFWGPLYPNIAGYSFVLPTAALFLLLLSPNVTAGRRISLAVAFLLSVLAVFLAHPNAIFVLYVFLAPFAVQWTYRALEKSRYCEKNGRIPVLGAVAVLVLAITIWVLLYCSPAMGGVISYGNWTASCSKRQALVNAIFLSLSDRPGQLFVSLLVFCGFFIALSRGSDRKWLAISYCVSALMYIVNASTDGLAKSFLTGFWYSDMYRIAAIVVLFAFPLACLGLDGLIAFAIKFKRFLEREFTLSFTGIFSSAAFGLLCIFAIYYPNFDLVGTTNVNTAFGMVQEDSRFFGNLQSILNPQERAFVGKVKQAIPDGAVVLNQPYDGSAFAYANDDLNVFYRFFGIEHSGSSESAGSKLIRTKLNFVSSDNRVKQAVENTGAQYVLILGYDRARESEEQIFSPGYDAESWNGFDLIRDDTPGFEIVLSEGDMRLYRITAF